LSEDGEMGIEKVRIDDRLIHGQILVAWARALSLDTLVIVSDDAAADPIEKELLEAGAPGPYHVEVIPVEEAVGKINSDAYAEQKAMILLPSAREALKLVEAGARLGAISVGGIHYSEGRRRILPYLYLDGEDEEALRRIASSGVRLEIQDVPANRSWMLEDLVGVEGESDSGS